MSATHLNGLKVLEACIRRESFKAAAEELAVTPAAVGQQIRILEGYLGCQLFERTKSGAKPTERAKKVIGQLSSGLSLLDDVMRQLKSVRQGQKVAITLPSSFAENWFSHRLSDLYQGESEIDLRLDATNRMVDIVSEYIDFAIRYCTDVEPIYEESVLFGDYVLPVYSPEFARVHELTSNSRSLKNIPLVHLISRTPDPQWPDWPMWSETGYPDMRHPTCPLFTQTLQETRKHLRFAFGILSIDGCLWFFQPGADRA